MNEKPKTKWYWRLLRWGLIALAVMATLIAILVTEEDWRGKRDWENYKQAAEARGERFCWAAFDTNAIPDDQNFFKAPIFQGLAAAQWDEKTQDWKQDSAQNPDRFKMSPYRSDGTFPVEDGGDWSRMRFARLENWQDYYRHPKTNRTDLVTSESISNVLRNLNIRALPNLPATNLAVVFPVSPQPQTPAADVLLALSVYNPVIEELREASRRPFARLGGYSAIERGMSPKFLYLLADMKSCFQVLHLRTVAELADNQPAQALDDVQLMLRLDDKLRQEPLLIEHLVSVALTAITIQPIYEGLAQHRWNDAQLAGLESALAQKDFLADYQFAMRGERTFAIDAIENQRITRQIKTMAEVGGKPKEVTIGLRWSPSAFFYQTELAFAELHEQLIQPLLDITNRIVSPAAVRRADAVMQAEMKHYNPYKVQALMLFPAISASVTKFARIQAQVDLARVACALERFRLANGNYPETLGALAPQFIARLPHDIINGQPLHYRRTDDGRFVLYSIGWDEKDDGGNIFLTTSGSIDQKRGDWVWQYPQK
jgi:hypothetical protein